MKKSPRYVKMAAIAVTCTLSACSVELETPTNETGVPTYTNKVSELYEIECNAERAGSKVFVNFEQMTFECDGTQWNGAYPGRDSTKRVIAPEVDRNFAFGSFIDERDNQTYKTIKIGNQNWFAQNLNFKANESWCPDDTDCTREGRYYSWYGAMDLVEDEWLSSFDSIEPEHQGACPAGWHVPAIDEWEELFAFVAGTSEYKSFEDSVAYKLRSDFGWKYNMNGWDVYGFALTPSGYYDREFDFEVTEKTTSIYQWSATPGDGYRTHSKYFEMADDMILIGPSYDNKSAMSVRCIENTPPQESADTSAADSTGESAQP